MALVPIATAGLAFVLATRSGEQVKHDPQLQAKIRLRRVNDRISATHMSRAQFADYVQQDVFNHWDMPIYDPTKHGSDYRPWYNDPAANRSYRYTSELLGRGQATFGRSRVFPEDQPGAAEYATAAQIARLASDAEDTGIPLWKFRRHRERDD